MSPSVFCSVSSVSTRDAEAPGGYRSGVFIAEKVNRRCILSTPHGHTVIVSSSLYKVPFETKGRIVS
jgi:hypothetical protein